MMKRNEEHKKDFYNEKSLSIAVPLQRATESWLTLEDAGEKEKATMLYFGALEGKKLYTASAVSKNGTSYVRLYIANVTGTFVWSVYVKRESMYDEERYHHQVP